MARIPGGIDRQEDTDTGSSDNGDDDTGSESRPPGGIGGPDEEDTMPEPEPEPSGGGGSRRPGGIDEQDSGGTSGGGGSGQSRPPGGIGGPDDTDGSGGTGGSRPPEPEPQPDEPTTGDGTGEESRPPGEIGGPGDSEQDGTGGPAESRPPEPVPGDGELAPPEEGEESRPPGDIGGPQPPAEEVIDFPGMGGGETEQPPGELSQPEQGLETQAEDAFIREQAEQFEADFLSGQSQFEEKDVRVTRNGDTFGLELTRSGREVATADQFGLTEEDITVFDGRVFPDTETAEQQFAIQDIESQIESEFPDAESFSIAAEGDAFEVSVTTAEGGTETFTLAPGGTIGPGDVAGTPVGESRGPVGPFAEGVGPFESRPPGSLTQTARQQATADIISQIEAETGAELAEGDVTVERVTEDGETRFQGTLTESGQTKVEVATGQRPEGAEAFRTATESGGFLTEEREARLAERSAEFQETASDIGEGVVDFFDIDIGAAEDTGFVGPGGRSPQQRTFEGAISGTVGFLDPFQAVKAGETATEIAQSIANEEVDFEKFASATTAVAAFTGREAKEAFAESPQAVGGQLLGGAGAGFAVGAASPLRFSKINIPDTEGGTQTIRTAQLGFPGGTRKTLTPGAKQIKTRPTRFQTPTKNIAGTRGFKPTIGTPKADIDTVDFSKLGTRADEAFEPTGQLETQVFRKTFEAEGAETTAARIGAVRELMQSGKKSRRSASLELTSAEDIAQRVEAVPEGEAGRVAAKLQETEASIFGSAATEAQLPGFRQGVLERPAPKDIDVVVPDEAAKAELQAFESELDADIFDIKLEEKVPGRAAGGKPIKFGQRSQPMLETEEGVPVNPASEELLRKAGAAGFFRGTDAPEIGEFDIGPQPVRPGRLSTRQKDVLDAIAMGEELLGPEAKSARRFRSAFEDIEGVGPAQGPITLRDRLELNTFLADTRGQGGIGTTRGTREIGIGTGDVEDVVRRFDDDIDAGTSPTRTTDIETTRPSTAASAALSAGKGQVGTGSVGTSPGEEAVLSPSTPVDVGPSTGGAAGVDRTSTGAGVADSDFISPVEGVGERGLLPINIDITTDSPGGGDGGTTSPTGSPSGGTVPGGSPGGGGGVPPFEGGPSRPVKRPDEDDREREERMLEVDEFAEKFTSDVATPEEVLEANFGQGILSDDET